MQSSDQLRNYNQRLIPLTEELIQDMLENEGLEYQTPPGGHWCEHEDSSLPSQDYGNQNWLKTLESVESDRERKSDQQKEQKEQKEQQEPSPSVCNPNYQLELLYSGQLQQYSNNSSDEQTSSFNNIIEMLRSVERLNSITDAKKVSSSCRSSKQTEQSEKSPREFGSRRRLYCSSSDSLISKSSRVRAEERDLSAENFYNMNQYWINLMVVPKSKTSFQMNQCKTQNHKTNSCNAYYTTTAKDLERDREAVASLLARKRSQRNSRNARL